ncbi:MAG TPA: glycosyltransferase family 87 protein [Blastocatellia bacterium]|nr:glycosyltransferase family 87 protein [Blastocatellia bacterium]
MTARTPHRIRRLGKLTLVNIFLALLALASLSYAVVTAPANGKDLFTFQQGAKNWLTRSYQFGAGPGQMYPPFTLPLFSPLTLFSFEHALLLMLALNLAATAAIIYFTVKLWGARWSNQAIIFFAAFFLSWAPYRVTLRLGQISLIIVALLLGALLARQKKNNWLAGALLGISLCKYSLTLPFFLYFLWKREWKLIAAAVTVMAALTQVFAWHLGITALDATLNYIHSVGQLYAVKVYAFTGTTEIKMLILSLTGGKVALATAMNIALSLAALVCLAVVVRLSPKCEATHLAALAAFAMWSAYHRTYDAMLCIIPSAVLIDFYARGRFVRFSRFWIAALGLFIISVPGLLTERLKLSEADLLANPAGWLGLHIESLLVFALFWSMLWLAWKRGAAPEQINERREPEASPAPAS